MGHRIELTLLGGFEARIDSGPPVLLPARKARALLAYLALPTGRTHPRDKLATLLWAEGSDRQARASLRKALTDVRRALGPAAGVLRTAGDLVSLDPDRVDVDTAAFERAAAGGTSQSLGEAAALYQGDLLAGLVPLGAGFEEWLLTERERLREVAVEALARLLAEQTRAAANERATRTAVRLLGLDPLQEAVHRTLMRLYARQGRRGAALKQYQGCVGMLRRELGAEPEAETKALYQELLRCPAEMPRRSPPARAVRPAVVNLPATETPLFGRQPELARLRQRLEEAICGHGHIATVVGEAGIGKTRLVSALAVEALSRGCQVLVGPCHETDSILPFGPWVDACRSGKLGADDELLAALPAARRAELARLLPEAGMAGLPPTSDSPLPLFESVADLLERVAARQPLVLVVDDMHWADEMSLRLLAFVSRRVPAWPALLITTARDEDLIDAALAQRTMEELARAPRATRLALSPLSRADIGLMVQALARPGRDAPALTSLEEQIWAMSEGNPLVVVEAMLAEESQGDGARDAPRELSLPDRVRDLVVRRLDRLSRRGQSMAAVAAVIGRRFDFTLLRLASRVEEQDAVDAVEELVRARILRAVGNDLDFTHDRVRAVAYGRLLPARRRMLHAAVAEALETASAGSGDPPREHIEQLAYHALRGELRDKAVRYLRQAGDKAAARSALLNARTWFEQALDVVETLPALPPNLEQAFEIRLALRPVLVQLGEFRQALARLQEAEALAERLNDDGRRGQVCAFMTNIHSRLDEPDAAFTSGTRALEIAGRLGDLRLRILATTYLEQAHFCRGEYERVIQLARRNIAALPSEWVHEFFGGSQPPAIHDRFRLLVSLAHLGRFAEAAEHEAEVIRLAEPTQHPYTIAMAYYAAGTLHLLSGDWGRARGLIERQIAALRAGNIAGELPNALAYSASALAYLGDASEARNRCLEAEQLLESQSARRKVSGGWTYCSLGRACLLLGRLDEAQRLADAALQSASGRVDFVPDALRLLGDLAIHPDRFDAGRARACYAKALAVAEPRGMHPLVAHCHFGLGELCRGAGDRVKAGKHLTIAATMYRKMDMAFWFEKADAARRRPPRHARARLR